MAPDTEVMLSITHQPDGFYAWRTPEKTSTMITVETSWQLPKGKIALANKIHCQMPRAGLGSYVSSWRRFCPIIERSPIIKIRQSPIIIQPVFFPEEDQDAHFEIEEFEIQANGQIDDFSPTDNQTVHAVEKEEPVAIGASSQVSELGKRTTGIQRNGDCRGS